MIDSVAVADASGRRRFSADALPLSLGGDGADVVLPGAASGRIVGYLACNAGHAFVQPADGAPPLLHNGKPLTESAWLGDGDRLRAGTAEIRCRLATDCVELRVQPGAPGAPLRPPPSVPPPATGASGHTAAVAAPPSSGRRGRGLRRLLSSSAAILLLVMLAAALFVFLAAPVSLTVRPAPERLEIEGTLPAVPLGERYLLYPDSYRLVAERSGYERLEQRFEVTSADHQQFAFIMKKLPGVLSVTSSPVEGAQVSIDGSSVGVTPIEGIDVDAGQRVVRVQAERYLPVERVVEIEGLGRAQSVEVELTPRWAAVTFASRPAGASVRVDGEPIGTTPLTVDLLEGRYDVEVSLADHVSARDEITVVANRPQRLPEFVLELADGQLAVASVPVGATVTLDGVFQGVTPLELVLAARRPHELRLSRAGFENLAETVSVAPNERLSRDFVLAPQYGTVYIAIEPPDAELYVDGQRQQSTTQPLRLTVAPHQIEIRKAGFEPHAATVTPRDGVALQLSITLQSSGAGGGAAPRADRLTTAEGQELRLLGPARFTMGASRREQGRRANEDLRAVELTRAFYIGTREVTNEEFRRFRPRHASGAMAGMSLDGPHQPVVGVSWDDAARYLNWLSKKDALDPAYVERNGAMLATTPLSNGYRLPTEAEWEYVARFAGREQAAKYPWGNGYPPRAATGNFADASAAGLIAGALRSYDDAHPVSAPVGSYAPNAVGLFDVGGNVAEWCHDYYALYPDAEHVVAKDPLGPVSGRHRVVRGASWRRASISELRLSYRDYSDSPRSDVGFRIARYAD